MADQRFGTKPLISLDGTRLPAPYDDQIATVVVDQDLTAATACEVVIADPQRTLIEDVGIKLGQKLTSEASPVAGEDSAAIFDGIVHTVDTVFREDGQSVVLVAYDGSFPLHQHRMSVSYNDVTVADAIRDLCSRLDINVGTIDTASVVFSHIGLFDETPWEFLSRHAASSGCVIRFEDDQLDIAKPAPVSTGPDEGDHGARDPSQLVPGHNLTNLRLHSTSARQVAEVEVRGWDPAKKEPLIASGQGATETAATSTDPSEVGSSLGGGKVIVPRPTLSQQASCDHHAAALGAEFAAKHVVADGEAIGTPELSAGGVVSIGAVGPMGGTFLLTHCRHRFDDEGYATEFRCSGLDDRSLFGLLTPQSDRCLGGVYPAIVTDVVDSDRMGRAKVRFPWLSEEYESDWARVGQPGAGPERGLHWFPEVDDEVIVSFIGGRPEAPVLLGGLYNGVDAAAFAEYVNDQGGTIERRGMRTRVGHTIELIDAAGEEAIRVASADGALSVVLDQAQGVIEVKADGELILHATGPAKLSTDDALEVFAKSELSLTSDGDVTVKGRTINLN